MIDTAHCRAGVRALQLRETRHNHELPDRYRGQAEDHKDPGNEDADL
jgi:hypothetical protein